MENFRSSMAKLRHFFILPSRYRCSYTTHYSRGYVSHKTGRSALPLEQKCLALEAKGFKLDTKSIFTEDTKPAAKPEPGKIIEDY